MIRRSTALTRRFGRVWRYLVVGGGVTLGYSMLTAAFVTSLVIPDPALASAASTFVTQPFAFLAHRAITYRDVEPDRRHWKRFSLLAVSTLILNVGIMKLTDVVHWPFWLGLAIGWVVIPVANYLITAIWIFRAGRLLSMSHDC